jgi:hypothetical protein
MKFQFSMKTLLIAMLCAAFFFAGMALQRKLGEPEWVNRAPAKRVPNSLYVERIKLRDGSVWRQRGVQDFPDE